MEWPAGIPKRSGTNGAAEEVLLGRSEFVHSIKNRLLKCP